MRKALIIIVSAILLIMIQVNAFSDEGEEPARSSDHSQHEFYGKIGTSYASDPEKFGLDVSLGYMYEIDPYFACGLGMDFFWINWSNKIGEEDVGGGVIADVEVETNAYAIPIFANAQIRLPDLFRNLRLEPSITVGLGYTVMFLNYTRPSYTDAGGQTYTKKDKFLVYGGFAWQVLASMAWRPSSDSAINFMLDLGYRGLYPERENTQIDMSGFIVRLGVTVYL